MMDVNQILQIMKKEYPERTVLRIFDYDENIYLVEAVLHKGEVDYTDPLFGVIKKGGNVIPFNPMSNIEKFTSTVKSKPMYQG